MDLYTPVLNGTLILLAAVFIRHTLYRTRFFMHIFQQVGYKPREYRNWLNEHFFSTVFTPEHLFYNAIILLLLFFLTDVITLTAGTLITSTFALFWFAGVSRYKKEKEKKPLVFTPRLKRLAALFFAGLAALWMLMVNYSYQSYQIRDFAAPFIQTDPYFLGFGFLLVDMLVPYLMFPAAWLMMPVEKTIQNGFKKQARRKLASLPGLKVIAITGSYGKTSTKFLIDAFLKERLNVCVTPGSYNTPMGICKVINNDLNAHHQVLILEMGARYRGNIKELCNIAKPDIAVITNVGISHLETFGSQETIAEEKSTLARELKTGGTLILNGDDPLVRGMASLREDVHTVFTGTEGSIRASHVKTGTRGTTFEMTWADGGKQDAVEKITTRLLGVHNIQNMLLAAAVACEFDIRLKTVSLAAATMQPVEHRLELKERNGLLIIDDAFNSNPVGAKNAVDVLASFEGGKKILITPGMIELGDRQSRENRLFGEHIGRAGIDHAILVGREQTAHIHEGILSADPGGATGIDIVNSLFEANDLLTDIAEPGDVVLYENDLPDTYSSAG